MTGLNLINQFNREFYKGHLSFFDSVLDKWSKVQGFPFWNVVKYAEGKYGLEIGLAGYKKSDVLVEVKDGVLQVEGKVDDAAVEYIQKGLSTKSFFKQFQLPNDAIVDEAKMEDGLLKIVFGYSEDKNSQKVDVK